MNTRAKVLSVITTAAAATAIAGGIGLAGQQKDFAELKNQRAQLIENYFADRADLKNEKFAFYSSNESLEVISNEEVRSELESVENEMGDKSVAGNLDFIALGAGLGIGLTAAGCLAIDQIKHLEP